LNYSPTNKARHMVLLLLLGHFVSRITPQNSFSFYGDSKKVFFHCEAVFVPIPWELVNQEPSDPSLKTV
jgi:hypothetical protein